MHVSLKKKLSQSGLLSLHALIPLVLVVVAIGGVGAYVLHKSKAATPSAQAIGSGYMLSGSASPYIAGGLPLIDPFSTVKTNLKLITTAGTEYTGKGCIDRIAWSPNGLKLLLRGRSNDCGLNNKGTIAIANAVGTGYQQIYATPTTNDNIMEFAWSPDGSKIGIIQTNVTTVPQSSQIIVIDTAGKILNQLQINDTAITANLHWNPSGTKLLYTQGSVRFEYTVASATNTQLAIIPQSLPIDYLDDSHLITLDYDFSSKTQQLKKTDLTTGQTTLLATTPGTTSFARAALSNDRQWYLENNLDAKTLTLVKTDGSVTRTIDTKAACGTQSANAVTFAPDSKSVLYSCGSVAKVYNIATQALTNGGQAFTTFWSNSVNAEVWQPAIVRVSSKTCVSGSYTMKSDVTFSALSGGRRIINPVVITPMIGTAKQAKRVDYTVTVQTLKGGVWTTIQTLGPTTTATTAAPSLNPTDPLEYGIQTTRVIISSGVYGDAKANCSVVHYSS